MKERKKKKEKKVQKPGVENRRNMQTDREEYT